MAKIGDLGLSKVVQSSITELPLGGTLAFAAPEVLLNMRCNEKVPAACSTSLHRTYSPYHASLAYAACLQ